METNRDVRISIDWLRITFQSITVNKVMELLGTAYSDWSKTQGVDFYKTRFLWHGGTNCFILADGIAENMGVNLTISGSGISDVVENFYRTKYAVESPWGMGLEVTDYADNDLKMLMEFIQTLVNYGTFCRVDVALDERYDVTYTPQEIYGLYRDGYVSTRVHKSSVKLHTDCADGSTCYMGSRAGNRMLRIYDKRAERRAKGVAQDEDSPWVRWEFELKHEYADAFVRDMLRSGVTHSFYGCLADFMRIHEKDDANSTRCTTSAMWLGFCNATYELKLYRAPREKMLSESRDWILRQVVPTLCAVAMASGDGFDWISDRIIEWSGKIKNTHIKAIETMTGDSFAHTLEKMSSGQRYVPEKEENGVGYRVRDTWYNGYKLGTYSNFRTCFAVCRTLNNDVRSYGSKHNEKIETFEGYTQGRFV